MSWWFLPSYTTPGSCFALWGWVTKCLCYLKINGSGLKTVKIVRHWAVEISNLSLSKSIFFHLPPIFTSNMSIFLKNCTNTEKYKRLLDGVFSSYVL
jgi:hypothetical protein